MTDTKEWVFLWLVLQRRCEHGSLSFLPLWIFNMVKRKEAGTWKDFEKELEDLNEEPSSKENEWIQAESREADAMGRTPDEVSPQLPSPQPSAMDPNWAEMMWNQYPGPLLIISGGPSNCNGDNGWCRRDECGGYKGCASICNISWATHAKFNSNRLKDS